MPARDLPERPNLEQYRKQAKERARAEGIALTQAQFAIAREHGFESWPKFTKEIDTLRITREVAGLADPVAAFMNAAVAPRAAHATGTLEEADLILARHPQVAGASIFTAATLADEARVRQFISAHPSSVTAKGGPLDCDALTYLCFSRYLRLDTSRSDAFVRTARALLDAGAHANTGWVETIDLQTTPRQIIETAIYGAAGIAQHADLTRLLLERGADPNDEETPYHVPETRDNTVLQILLDSGKLSAKSLGCVLLRKADWHDLDGLRLALDHGANPTLSPGWRTYPLSHAIERDNDIEAITALLDHGADPTVVRSKDGRSPLEIAAHRGRGDVLMLFQARGIPLAFEGVGRLIAACAMDDGPTIGTLLAHEPALKDGLLAQGGTLLGQFSGVGNLWGVRRLLDCGIDPNVRYREGDAYFGTAKNSTALHVAAWRANHDVVKELIARHAHVNALDGQERTPLQLAVKACVDSYWMADRSPESVKALLDAGASRASIEVPTGYDEVDALLRRV